MSAHFLEDDVSTQQAAVTTARASLADVLDQLARKAKDTARTARSKRGAPALEDVYALTLALRAAEETLDIALYDLSTASGEDG